MIKIHGVIFWIQPAPVYVYTAVSVNFLTIQQIRLFKIANLYIFWIFFKIYTLSHLLVSGDIPQGYYSRSLCFPQTLSSQGDRAVLDILLRKPYHKLCLYKSTFRSTYYFPFQNFLNPCSLFLPANFQHRSP